MGSRQEAVDLKEDAQTSNSIDRDHEENFEEETWPCVAEIQQPVKPKPRFKGKYNFISKLLLL